MFKTIWETCGGFVAMLGWMSGVCLLGLACAACERRLPEDTLREEVTIVGRPVQFERVEGEWFVVRTDPIHSTSLTRVLLRSTEGTVFTVLVGDSMSPKPDEKVEVALLRFLGNGHGVEKSVGTILKK